MERITPAEAVKLARVSDRTLRTWVKQGKITRYTGADGRPRFDPQELRAVRPEVHPEALPEAEGETSGSGSPTGSLPEAEGLAALRQALATAEQRAELAERRIAGAHQAARVLALRLSEALAGLDRERQRAEGLAEELAALRQELRDERERAAEREQQHAAAERELRVLLLRSSESLAAVVSAHQAPALTISRARPWWRVWDR